MGTAVSTMSILLSRRLADEVSSGSTDGERFTADQRLSALDGAYDAVVLAILGHTNARKSAYQLLGDLAQRDNKEINAAGVSLNSFTYNITAGGVYSVECVIDGKRVYGVERELDDLQWAGNEYHQGNDLRPVFYVLSNTLYVEVTLGSYPVTTYVHYIRQPKQLDYSTNSKDKTTTLETSGSLDEIILTAAVGIAQQMSDDQAKVQVANEYTTALVQSIVAHEFGKSNKRLKGDA